MKRPLTGPEPSGKRFKQACVYLPPEVWLFILSFLSPRDRIKKRTVNQEWYDLICHESYWKGAFRVLAFSRKLGLGPYQEALDSGSSWMLCFLSVKYELCMSCKLRIWFLRMDTHPIFRFCDVCRDWSAPSLVSKARAKEVWKLSEEELGALIPATMPNPHYPGAPTYILYREDQVRQIAWDKLKDHGDIKCP